MSGSAARNVIPCQLLGFVFPALPFHCERAARHEQSERDKRSGFGNGGDAEDSPITVVVDGVFVVRVEGEDAVECAAMTPVGQEAEGLSHRRREGVEQLHLQLARKSGRTADIE